MNLLMKQNTDILKFNYRNLEELSAAANNNTKEKSELEKEAVSLNSSELSDLQDAEITAEQLKEKLQNSNIMNVTEDFNNALISNQKTDKKDCIYTLNLSELRKVLQDHYRKIKRSMHLFNKNNLKKDKNVQTYL